VEFVLGLSGLSNDFHPYGLEIRGYVVEEV